MYIKLNYFTSTGNTLWAAEKVRDFWKAKGHEVDLFDSVTCGINAVEACDMSGFIYPVWGSTLPNPQRELIERMMNGNGQRVFLIGNAGVFSGDTGFYWKGILEQKGYDVVYADHVFLPINSVFPGFSWFKTPGESARTRMKQKAEQRLYKICEAILAGKRKYAGQGLFATIGGRGQRNNYDTVVNHFKQEMYIDAERCNGCGLCYRICPVEAIRQSDDEKYMLSDNSRCIFCLKCYNFCPRHAVLKGAASRDTRKYTRYTGLEATFTPIVYRHQTR